MFIHRPRRLSTTASAFAAVLCLEFLGRHAEVLLEASWRNPFAPIDPQVWVNPDDMT